MLFKHGNEGKKEWGVNSHSSLPHTKHAFFFNEKQQYSILKQVKNDEKSSKKYTKDSKDLQVQEFIQLWGSTNYVPSGNIQK